MGTTRKTKRKLTPRQERFVSEYLVDLKAGPAAIRAGYAPRTAETCGPRLLRFAQVAEAIAKAKEKRLAKIEITQERVLAELALLAFSDLTHYQTDDEGNVTPAPGAPEGAMRVLQSVKKKLRSYGKSDDDGSSDGASGIVREAEVEIRLWDKPGMLKLAGRHVGLFPDRVEVVGAGGGPVQIETAPKTSADLRRELAGLVASKPNEPADPAAD